MKIHQTIITILLTFLSLGKELVIVECRRSSARTITINKFANCSNDEKNPINYYGSVTNIARNMYKTSGVFTIEEIISAPIELQIIANRCDFNMTKCENLNTFILRDVCKLADQTDQIWSDAVAHCHPRPKCPLNIGELKISNASVDLDYLAYLPVDGYTWTLHFKAFKSIAKMRHKKQLLFCLMAEFTATKNRGGQKTKRISNESTSLRKFV